MASGLLLCSLCKTSPAALYLISSHTYIHTYQHPNPTYLEECTNGSWAEVSVAPLLNSLGNTITPYTTQPTIVHLQTLDLYPYIP
jgi:hypothetical protein